MKEYCNAPLFARNQIDEIIRIEGGYINDPSDSGGATKYGITEKVARKWGYTGHMRDLPLELAQNIYVNDYWYTPRFDILVEHSYDLACEVFEEGVNLGVVFPSKNLQMLLNVFNRQQRDYKDIVEDGIIGNKTKQALESFILKRGENGKKVLFNLMNSLQGAKYVELAHKREKDEKWIWGWASQRLEYIDF